MDKTRLATIFVIFCTCQPAIGFQSYGYPEGFDIGAEKTPTAETYYDYHIEVDERGNAENLPCPVWRKLNDLREDCAILKVFNQTQVDLMEGESVKSLAETCACQLMWMNNMWERSYDSDTYIRKVAHLVRRKTNQTLRETHSYPTCFWTDVEIVSLGISVYTSTRDYFHQLHHNPAARLSPEMRQLTAKDPNWNNIGFACRKISADRFSVYRYLENLARLSPSVFFRLILNDEMINMVYQASKACKMLLLLRLDKYKLRPDDETIIVANRTDGETATNARYNIIEDSGEGTRDIETIVYQARALLPNNCNNNNKKPDDPQAIKCPIAFNQGDTGDNVKIWLTNNVTAPTVRSMAAIQCGCQLLQYNSTWEYMTQDPDVAIMSKALTNYMNNNRAPDIASAPQWVLYGWFRDIMWELSKNRKNSIKEIMNTRRGGQEDPTSPTGKDKSSEALDLLRRGCLVVVLNYDPVTRRKGRFRLVQYLDDLQSISSDPMFVFQLTLQDLNLFKIYALSKMCQPIM